MENTGWKGKKKRELTFWVEIRKWSSGREKMKGESHLSILSEFIKYY